MGSDVRDVYTRAPVDDVLENLAVLLAVANADVMLGKPMRSVVDNARRSLCEALGVTELDTPVASVRERLLANMTAYVVQLLHQHGEGEVCAPGCPLWVS